MREYRQKIYKYYSSKRIGRLAPDTVDGFKLQAPYFLKLIREHFPKDTDATILDLGCGHGAFVYHIQRAGYTRITGVDASEEQVREARRLGVRGVQHGDLVAHLNAIDSSSVDLLIAIDVIEHFTKDELSDLVDEFYRVLRTRGKVVSHQPNSEGPFGSFMRHWDYTHELAFTRQSIAQLFLASGFSDIRSYEDKPVVHGLRSLIRFILWEYAIRNVYRCLVTIECGACPPDAIFSQNFLTIATK